MSSPANTSATMTPPHQQHPAVSIDDNPLRPDPGDLPQKEQDPNSSEPASMRFPAATTPAAAQPVIATTTFSASSCALSRTSSSSQTRPSPPEDEKTAAGLPRTSTRDPFEVYFGLGGDDREDPRSWSEWRKWQILGVGLLTELWANAISAIYAPGALGVQEEFGVSQVVSRLPAALYLYGFAVGPVFSAPLSEDYGRWPIHVTSVAVLGLLQIACALTPTFAGLVVSRFIAGVAAAAIFNVIGVVSDLWVPEEQGWGVNSFALAAELGAGVAPIFSGYLYQRAGWRWLFGVSGIVTAFLFLLYVATVPETRAGVLLERRAAKLRKETGDARYFTSHARDMQARTPRAWLKEVLVRPLYMLATEPIVSSFAAFDSFNYLIIYLALEVLALIYSGYGFDTGAQGLPFIAVCVGFIIGYFLFFVQQALYRRAERRSSTGEAAPEAMLLWGIFGSVFFPISLFWFAWTSFQPIPAIVSILALGLFGISSHIIFMIVSEYTVRAYGPWAASAVAAQSFMREIMSGSATLIAEPMYHGLGNTWASFLLACVAIPLSLLPLLFYWLGPRIRARSPFAGEVAKMEAEAKAEREAYHRSTTTSTDDPQSTPA